MKKNTSRLLALMMVFMMMTSTLVVNAAVYTEENVTKDNTQKIDLELQSMNEEGKEVRVIIELDGVPIIEAATELGIHVDQMDEATVEFMSNELLAEQADVIEDAQADVDDLQIHEQFTNVFNGFSATMKVRDLEEVAKNPHVVAIKIANEYDKPVIQMDNSGYYTKSDYVNSTYGYTGEGMVVAVLDTGIDVLHQDMVIDADVIPAYDETLMNEVIAANGLQGQYYTEKVPYGYNYYDLNDYLPDDGEGASMHGMHVSGTIAANGLVKGVAPNAQLLMMRVFSNDPETPSTYSDIIIAAIDDAIVLGADVMNLSLGSTAGYVDATDPEQQAVTRAVENGIVMSISAGNSAYYGAGNERIDIPFAHNPDIGLVGSPGLTEAAISVASLDNYAELYTSVFEISLGEDYIDYVIGYGKDEWLDYSGELVFVPGYGSVTDYDGIDVEGKIAVVSRGELSFYDKTVNAMNNGAASIIVYNNSSTSAIYYNQGKWGIPFMLTDYDNGQLLLHIKAQYDEDLAAGMTTETLNGFGYTVEAERDPDSGYISSFSSYGTTSTLEFKPEITAPGGGIYSTLNDNSYGMMSGTSMAAPHVTGGAVLVLQRINSDPEFIALGLTEYEKSVLCKNMLMNTAVKVLDKATGEYESVRTQGAGSMNLRYAVESTVVVTEVTSGTAKVNLGEFTGDTVEFELLVQNIGGENELFDVSAGLTTDEAITLVPELYANTLESMELAGDFAYFIDGVEMVELDGLTKLELTPYQTVTLKVVVSNIDTAYLDTYYKNGYFVEGFLNLDYIVDTTPEIDAIWYDIMVVYFDILDYEEDLELLLNGADGISGLNGKILEYDKLMNKYMVKCREFGIFARANEAILNVYELKNVYLGLEEERAQLRDEIDQIKVLIANKKVEINNAEVNNAAQEVLDELNDELEALKDQRDQLISDIDVVKIARDEAEQVAIAAYDALTDDEKVAYDDIIAEYEALDINCDLLYDQIVVLSDEIDSLNYDKAIYEYFIEEGWKAIDIWLEDIKDLEDDLAESTSISVPFMGFYGDFEQADAFDATIYDMYNYSFYGITGLVNESGYFLGYTNGEDYTSDLDDYSAEEFIAISPNYDGYSDAVSPVFSMTRNMVDMSFDIEDEDGIIVSHLESIDGLRKTWYDSGYGPMYHYYGAELAWDGTSNHQVVEDGQYSYVISGFLADGVTPKELSIPVKVDTVGPTINDIIVDATAKTMTIDATDFSGVNTYMLIEDEIILDISSNGVLDTSAMTGTGVMLLIAIDHAENVIELPLVLNGDMGIVNNVLDNYIYNTDTINVSGSILGVEAPQLRIDENAVDTTEILGMDQYIFNYLASYDTDGYKELVSVVSEEDAEGEFVDVITNTNSFFVDSTAPIITDLSEDVDLIDGGVRWVADDIDTFEMSLLIEDNFPKLDIFVNDEYVYSKQVEVGELGETVVGSSFTLTEEVSLQYGMNTFEVQAYDITNAYSRYIYNVYRSMPGEIWTDADNYAVDFYIEGAESVSTTTGEGVTLNATAVMANGAKRDVTAATTFTSNTEKIAVRGNTIYSWTICSGTITASFGEFSDTVNIRVYTPQYTTPSPTPVPTPVVDEEIVDEEIAEELLGFKAVPYIEGYGDRTFRPDAFIKRTEISAIFVRTMMLRQDKEMITFNDLATQHWSYEEVKQLVKAGIIEGYPDGSFKPSNNITKAELATMLAKAARVLGIEIPEVEHPYTDISGHWAEDDIATIYALGAYLEQDGILFKPDNKLTRAEAVVMINLVIGLEGSADDDEAVFDDVDADHWAYKYIQAAARVMEE